MYDELAELGGQVRPSTPKLAPGAALIEPRAFYWPEAIIAVLLPQFEDDAETPIAAPDVSGRRQRFIEACSDLQLAIDAGRFGAAERLHASLSRDRLTLIGTDLQKILLAAGALHLEVPYLRGVLLRGEAHTTLGPLMRNRPTGAGIWRASAGLRRARSSEAHDEASSLDHLLLLNLDEADKKTVARIVNGAVDGSGRMPALAEFEREVPRVPCQLLQGPAQRKHALSRRSIPVDRVGARQACVLALTVDAGEVEPWADAKELARRREVLDQHIPGLLRHRRQLAATAEAGPQGPTSEISDSLLIEDHAVDQLIVCFDTDPDGFCDWVRTLVRAYALTGLRLRVGVAIGPVSTLKHPVETFSNVRCTTYGPAVSSAIRRAHLPLHDAAERTRGEQVYVGLGPDTARLAPKPLKRDVLLSAQVVLGPTPRRRADTFAPSLQTGFDHLLRDARVMEPLHSICMGLVLYCSLLLMGARLRPNYLDWVGPVFSSDKWAYWPTGPAFWVLLLVIGASALIAVDRIRQVKTFIGREIAPRLSRYHFDVRFCEEAEAAVLEDRHRRATPRPDSGAFVRQLHRRFLGLHAALQLLALTLLLAGQPMAFDRGVADSLSDVFLRLHEWFLMLQADGAPVVSSAPSGGMAGLGAAGSLYLSMPGLGIMVNVLLLCWLLAVVQRFRVERIVWDVLFIGSPVGQAVGRARHANEKYRMHASLTFLACCWLMATFSNPVSSFTGPSVVGFLSLILLMVVTLIFRYRDWCNLTAWLDMPGGVWPPESPPSGWERLFERPPSADHIEQKVRAEFIRAGAELATYRMQRSQGLDARPDDARGASVSGETWREAGWFVFDQHGVVHFAAGAVIDELEGDPEGGQVERLDMLLRAPAVYPTGAGHVARPVDDSRPLLAETLMWVLGHLPRSRGSVAAPEMALYARLGRDEEKAMACRLEVIPLDNPMARAGYLAIATRLRLPERGNVSHHFGVVR